jgi:hypothetical protein
MHAADLARYLAHDPSRTTSAQEEAMMERGEGGQIGWCVGARSTRPQPHQRRPGGRQHILSQPRLHAIYPRRGGNGGVGLPFCLSLLRLGEMPKTLYKKTVQHNVDDDILTKQCFPRAPR